MARESLRAAGDSHDGRGYSQELARHGRGCPIGSFASLQHMRNSAMTIDTPEFVLRF
jgi:hypothetical protein